MAKIDNIDRPTDAAFLLFHYAEEIKGITKVQKLLFLVENETRFGSKYSEDISFHFKPYKMGPFSAEVYSQVELLLSMNAIEAEDAQGSPSEGYEMKEWEPKSGSESLSHKKFITTRKGHRIGEALEEVIDKKTKNDLKKTVREYNSMPLRQLLEYVYKNYESMTEKSEIKEEVLG